MALSWLKDTLKPDYRDFLAHVKRIPKKMTPIPIKDQNRGISPKIMKATTDDNTGSKRMRVDSKVGETNLTA